MSENTDIYVLELLASKICHDLISPIGAVNNGVEFLQEMGADAGDEVTGLIAYSAQQASAKLQAYRIAYGAGGADDSLKPEDVHKSIESIVSVDGKIKQVWDPYADLGYGDDRPHAFSKLLMCALLFAKDCLHKGGELDVRAGHGDESHIIAKGENAALRDNIDGVMAMQIQIVLHWLCEFRSFDLPISIRFSLILLFDLRARQLSLMRRHFTIMRDADNDLATLLLGCVDKVPCIPVLSSFKQDHI